MINHDRHYVAYSKPIQKKQQKYLFYVVPEISPKGPLRLPQETYPSNDNHHDSRGLKHALKQSSSHVIKNIMWLVLAPKCRSKCADIYYLLF